MPLAPAMTTKLAPEALRIPSASGCRVREGSESLSASRTDGMPATD